MSGQLTNCYVIGVVENDSTPSCGVTADTVDRQLADARLATLLDQQLDAIWVRARLKFLFGVDSDPENIRIEKSLSSYSFIAIRNMAEDKTFLVPFECADHYGRTSLFFSPKEDDLDLNALVATAFWQLVGGDTRLADFNDRAYHPGAGVWMSYGCKDGELAYSEEEEDYSDEYDDIDDAG